MHRMGGQANFKIASKVNEGFGGGNLSQNQEHTFSSETIHNGIGS